MLCNCFSLYSFSHDQSISIPFTLFISFLSHFCFTLSYFLINNIILMSPFSLILFCIFVSCISSHLTFFPFLFLTIITSSSTSLPFFSLVLYFLTLLSSSPSSSLHLSPLSLCTSLSFSLSLLSSHFSSLLLIITFTHSVCQPISDKCKMSDAYWWK